MRFGRPGEEADPETYRRAVREYYRQDPAFAEKLTPPLTSRKQESKLIDLYQIDGIDLDMIKRRMDDLHKEQEQLSASLAEKTSSPAALSADDAIDALSSFESVFASDSLQDKRKLLRTLISRINVFPDHIDIKWNFSN